MPGFDRSGPMGAGPMTGGRRGPCGGQYSRPVNIGYGYGGGRGMGFRHGYGRGRGFGYRGYPAPPAFGPGASYQVSSADEMAMLQAEADAMKASLESIQNRIAELEKGVSE
ncbi:MAG: DUF5320 domain-containing protein [Deltaproteobacteria bacterium]|nr:DUF5320 domain-containing protein [Deltaproteobacteria bacterium]